MEGHTQQDDNQTDHLAQGQQPDHEEPDQHQEMVQEEEEQFSGQQQQQDGDALQRTGMDDDQQDA